MALHASFDDERKHAEQAVRWGFSWLAVGNIVNAACAWGRLALLARLGNTAMIGQLTLALAVCGPIAALADLGLSGSLISDAKRQYRIGDYLGLRLATCALAMLVIVAVAWTGGYDRETAELVVLAGLLVASESVCELFQAVLQRREEMRWVAISLMVRGVLGLVLFTLGIRFGGGVASGVCGFVLAAVTTLLMIDIPRAMLCERPYRKTEFIPLPSQRNGMNSVLRQPLILAWLSLPLGLATASLSLMTSLPRYSISARLGNEALGGFAVAGSVAIAISLVIGALSQAASPRLARYHAAGNTTALLGLLRGLGLWLGVVMIVSLLVMAMAGRWILALLFGPVYAPLAGLALCLMLAGGLRNFSIFLGRAITSMRRFRTGLLLRVISIAVLACLLPGWIGWLGAMGAAWALTLSWLVTVLLSLAAVLRELRRNPSNL